VREIRSGCRTTCWTTPPLTFAANVQLPFVADRIQGVWVYFWGSTNIDLTPTSLNAASWTINGQSTVDDLTRLLDANSVSWRVHDPLTFVDQTCILLQSNVHCLWSHDNVTELQKILLTNGCDDWLTQT